MNRVMLLGVVDREPRRGNGNGNGRGYASFSITVTERWTDRQSGEQKERKSFFPVATFTQEGIRQAEAIRPGSIVLVEGALSSRKDGETWKTEVSVGFGGSITVVGHTAGAVSRDNGRRSGDTNRSERYTSRDEDEDSIPF